MIRLSLPVRIASVWILVLSVLVGIVAPVAAQDQQVPPTPPAAEDISGPSFVLRPVEGEDGEFITVTAEAGATVEQRVFLGNAGEEPIKLRTYVAATVPVANGGFSVATSDVPPEGTATWITYPTEEIELQPDEGVERPVIVTVPANMPPGQYIAGLVLETVDPTAVPGSEQFRQVVRKSIAVFITVPGPETPEFLLGDPEFVITGPNETIQIPVTNSGNVLVKPSGEFTVRNTAGETILSRPIAMKSVYAGTTVPMSISLSPPLPDGDYQVTVELVDTATGASASLANHQLAIVHENAAPATFAITGHVALQPSEADPVFADVSVEITNTGTPIPASEVLLDIAKDGELVETFTLIPSLSLPQGTTTASQRYIPPEGFAPGTWTFTLRLNTLDPGTQTTTTVATSDPLPPITVGP